MENENESKLIKLIKDIIKKESLKDKYTEINNDIFIIISTLLDTNPDFFILIEDILLEIVKDNEINITIFNYAFLYDKIIKLFVIFNSLKLDELNNLLNVTNFVDLLKFIILLIYDADKENIPKYEEFILKINDTIKNITDTLNMFTNIKN